MPIIYYEIKPRIPRLIFSETNQNKNMKKLLFICTLLAICAFACKTSKKAADSDSNAPLFETQWMLTDIDGQPVGETPKKPFIRFTSDGGVSGNLGGDEIKQKIFEELLISCDGESDISIHIEDVEKFNIRVSAGRSRVKLPFSAVGRYLSLHIRSSEKLNEIGIIYE